MLWLIMLAQVFARAVEASFHRGNTGVESLSDLRMTASFLDECKQSSILRPQLPERVTQRIEFFGIDGTRRLGNIFMLLAERQKNTPQLLAPQLIDARVARESEQPRLELRRRLQAIDGANHFDEDLLRQILDVITSTGHGVHKAGNPMLVADDKLPLRAFVALLSTANEFGQRSR
jgi:hypothetical protein